MTKRSAEEVEYRYVTEGGTTSVTWTEGEQDVVLQLGDWITVRALVTRIDAGDREPVIECLFYPNTSHSVRIGDVVIGDGQPSPLWSRCPSIGAHPKDEGVFLRCELAEMHRGDHAQGEARWAESSFTWGVVK